MDDQWVKDKALEFSQTHNPKGLVPFPFEEAARRLEDVEILYLETMEDTISGAILFQDETYKMLINAKKPKARRYFTIAHEFGHYFLHDTWLREHQEEGFIDFVSLLDGESALFRPDLPLTSDESALRREREANNFAAEILMP
jgi:Zn-dependent peptidase ImmA (M78 family)